MFGGWKVLGGSVVAAAIVLGASGVGAQTPPETSSTTTTEPTTTTTTPHAVLHDVAGCPQPYQPLAWDITYAGNQGPTSGPIPELEGTRHEPVDSTNGQPTFPWPDDLGPAVYLGYELTVPGYGPYSVYGTQLGGDQGIISLVDGSEVRGFLEESGVALPPTAVVTGDGIYLEATAFDRTGGRFYRWGWDDPCHVPAPQPAGVVAAAPAFTG
jgi:hypothetical protein